MKKSAAILLAFGALLLSACSKCIDDNDYYYVAEHYLLTISNRTDSTIVWYVPEHGDVDCESVTGELPAELSAKQKNEFSTVAARSHEDIYIIDDGETSNLETYHPEDTVTFYFFGKKTLEKHSWAEIVENRMWLAAYSYSVEDMIKADKLVSFPSSVK